MPTPKFFRKFSSKDSEDSPDESPDTAPTTHAKGIPPEKNAIADLNVPQYSDAMKEAWSAANAELPQAHGVEKFLNRVETAQNAMTLSDGQQAVVDTLAVPAKALANTPQIADAIEKGVNTFMEAVPVLMKALDEVAKVHPFISVAVLAFKAVYTLEVKRRGNDKRVIALYAEMKDMMTVLLQLKDVSDPKKVAPDGQTIEGRMQKLCVNVAEDIKRCANTCDTYLKKKILVKIFAGPIWEDRLLEFVEIFTNRRKEFEFALTIHTAVGVDEANIKLDSVGERTAELNQKMEVMMGMFRKFVTPEQRQLALLVEQKGGDSIINNEQVMRELSDAEASISVPAGKERHKPAKKFDLAEIQHEIRDDPAVAIEKNAEFFNRKFDVQRRQIQEDIERAVSREGDRIISAVTSGPHERILDPDLHKIWKEMGWRGSVKARHFILALKDYYSEMVAGGDGKGIASSDQWTLEYIGVNYVRSILEAFDDDASGFVTVKEANNFTRSRPLDWSLPHWLAYWAIGWQTTCTDYCEKIEEIFDAMIRLSDDVLPENRKDVNEYIGQVWGGVTIFVRSFRWEEGTEDLRTKFRPHVDAEEARLQKNLEDIKYNIDSDDAVRLVSGHGRIETTLFSMLYLVLKRDLQKISLACKHVLADSELPEAVETIQQITYAVTYRISDLRAIFEQSSLSPEEQFANFAKGLYEIASEDDRFHGDRLRDLPDPIPARDEVIPDPDTVPLNILRYPTGDRHEIDFAAYDSSAPVIPSSVDGPDAVLGTFYGFTYEDQESVRPMMKWTFSRGSEENSIVASGTQYYAGYHKAYTISGTTGPLEDGKLRVELNISYASAWSSMNMTGYFDPEENSLRGTLEMPDGTLGEFVFKRDPDFVRLYPAPSVIDAQERWIFATTAILDRIRRESWSPSYIIKRIKDGKRYMQLAIRDQYYGRHLDDDELDEYIELFSSLYESDARFYASLINIKLSKVPIHFINCDSCGGPVGGARILCMDCHDNTSTIDLCSEFECLNSVITFESRSDHTPNHDMLKVHHILFDRDTARTERNAKDALEAARQTLSELKLKKKPMPKCVHCQNVVSLPCWYCVDCTKERFICADCEHEGLAFNEIHTKKHTLVRVVQKVKVSKVSTEERLRAVEGQLGSVQGELSKMRQLLSKLFEKGVEGSPNDPITKGDILDAVMAEPSLVGPPSVKGEDDHGGDDEEGSGDEDEDRYEDEDGDGDHGVEDEAISGDEREYGDEGEDEDEGRD